jgi:hypothetical protein
LPEPVIWATLVAAPPDPAALDPAAPDPAALDPAALDPAALDPAALDPAPAALEVAVATIELPADASDDEALDAAGAAEELQDASDAASTAARAAPAQRAREDVDMWCHPFVGCQVRRSCRRPAGRSVAPLVPRFRPG